MVKKLQCKIKGTEYNAGEYVILNPDLMEATELGIPENRYIAKIVHFMVKKKTVRAYINWFYWPEETHYGRLPLFGAKELVESTMFEHICVQTFMGKCNVLRLKEFCKHEINDDDYYCRFQYDGNVMKLFGGREFSEIPVYCTCAQPYNPDKHMVQCHRCKDWFHSECIGRGIKDEMDDENNYYTCIDCMRKKRRRLSEEPWKSKSLKYAMVDLKRKDLEEVAKTFNRSSSDELVFHSGSNTKLTVKDFQCLQPHQWLNDEVINVYFGLLMEREIRYPEKLLKCLFLSTFFWPKLKEQGYEAVKMWTNGYNFVDYHKIFVPIHTSCHWSLVVIDPVDRKFLYLDSLMGDMGDTTRIAVMEQLVKYYVFHVKDTSGKDIDMSTWKLVEVDDHPKQSNSYDCGMFMIKYADFYSRGLDLSFKEDSMSYFRLRTAKEILKLTAK